MNMSCPRCGTPFDPARSPEGLCPQCAFSAVIAAAPTAVDDLVRHLPGLDDIRVIGRGGMGVVYRARQKHLNREVAVKVISGQFTADAEFQKRFQQEAQVLASLDHPNIVKVHEFGIQGSLRYFVMEYVNGASLRESRLGSDDILRAIHRVAEALACAHGRGVVHRDIKPENILIREDGVVKVVDFGIARLADETRLTESGAAIGTPAYMAPEQRDDPHTADHRVDIYALGVLAYEMLTGQVPAGTFPPPSRVADVGERVDEIVLRAMDRNPARRFQTAQEMANALREVVEPEVAAAAAPPRLPLRHRLRRLKASRLFWVLATGAAFELAFLLSRLGEGVAPDPRAVFERFLPKDSRVRREELLKAFGDPRIRDQADATLAAEAGGKDPVRSGVALEIAYDLKRANAIPPDGRARALSHWQKDFGRDVSFSGLYDPDTRANLIIESIEEGGPPVAREILQDLTAGGVPEENRIATALGIARAADPSLVQSMYDSLQQRRDSPAVRDVLMVFAACVDLPLPARVHLLKPLPDEALEIYFRHLPGILDSESHEAHFSKALELAGDLSQWQESADRHFATNANDWLKAHGGKGATDAASLAGCMHLAWPLDDEAARRLEQDLRSRSDLSYPYARALLLHWRRTGRLTLPHYRWTGRFGSFTSILIDDLQAGRALLDSSDNATSTRWEAHAIWIPTIAGEPEPLDPVVGQGNVKATLARTVNEPGTALSVHYGMQSLMPSSKKEKFGSFKVEIEGAFSRTKSGKLKFDVNVSTAFTTQGGWSRGSSGSGERCRSGEATLLKANLTGSRSGDLRHGWFALLIVDPPAHGEPSQHWRPALTRALERLANGETWDSGGEPASSSGADDKLLQVAAWIPLPEARDALLKLWSSHDTHRELVGAALLLLGDPTPLAETAWLKEISPEVALRIYLFSSSAAARRAVEPHIGKPETNSDAEKVLERLEARGESDSPLAKACRDKMRDERTSRIKFFLPYLFGGLLVLSFGWFVPLGPNRRASVSYGLVLTGLVLRFLTFQVGERLWMPAAGDLLILVASFLYGGWMTRLLAAALAVSGTLQLMMPGSAPILFASGLLLCLYIGMMTCDLLTRWLPARIKKLELVALLAALWALVVPMGFLYATGLFLSLRRDTFTFSLFTVQGGWATAFLIAMIAGPLWLVRAQRVRLARK